MTQIFHDGLVTGDTGAVNSVAFSPRGRILATGDGGAVWLWDVTYPTNPRRLGKLVTGDISLVNWMAFSSDGRTLAAGFFLFLYNGVGVWDVTDPAAPRLLEPVTDDVGSLNSTAFSPDGHTAATVPLFGSAVWLWDVTDPADPRRLGDPLDPWPAPGG